MPNRRTDPARERLGRKRLARRKASGLKARSFCDREGVTPTAFNNPPRECRTGSAAARRASSFELRLRLDRGLDVLVDERQELVLTPVSIVAIHALRIRCSVGVAGATPVHRRIPTQRSDHPRGPPGRLASCRPHPAGRILFPDF